MGKVATGLLCIISLYDMMHFTCSLMFRLILEKVISSVIFLFSVMECFLKKKNSLNQIVKWESDWTATADPRVTVHQTII